MKEAIMATKVYSSVKPGAPVDKIEINLNGTVVIVDTRTHEVTATDILGFRSSITPDGRTLSVEPILDREVVLRRILDKFGGYAGFGSIALSTMRLSDDIFKKDRWEDSPYGRLGDFLR